MESRDLETLRARIDEIDREIVRLLNLRAQVSVEIGRLKSAVDVPTLVPDREAEVLSRVVEANRGPLQAQHIRAIYREVLSASRALQRPLRVAYLGPVGTFTHQAALERFGQFTDFVAVATISEVFLETQRGGADYGVVPVENSTEGSVHETLDMLLETDLRVCAEVTIPVVHNLLARGTRNGIVRLYSHPQAIAQCRRWIARHLPEAEVIQAVSTARAAELAASDPEGAAIATEVAASSYGLQVLERGIQDSSENYTRFLVLGQRISEQPSGRDRTSIAVSIKDRVGALRDLLEAFSSRGINLSSIQSRPSRKRAWDYVFFIELEGHYAEPRVRAALEEAEHHCVSLKVLGSWPTEVGR